MRTWILVREKDIPFEEINVPMRAPDCSAQRLRALLPAGKVPCLIAGDVTVWETLAIFEYLAEQFPEKTLWPPDRHARAHARAAGHDGNTGGEDPESLPKIARRETHVRSTQEATGPGLFRCTREAMS